MAREKATERERKRERERLGGAGELKSFQNVQPDSNSQIRTAKFEQPNSNSQLTERNVPFVPRPLQLSQ